MKRILEILLFTVLLSSTQILAEMDSEDDPRFFSHCTGITLINEGDNHFYKIFDYLEKAFSLARSIQDIYERASMINFLQSYCDRLKIDYVAKNYAKVQETADFLYGDSEVIFSICSNTKISNKIISCLDEMKENLDSKRGTTF